MDRRGRVGTIRAAAGTGFDRAAHSLQESAVRALAPERRDGSELGSKSPVAV